MSNDGNVVLSAGGITATVVTRSGNALGRGSLSRVTIVGSLDDGFTEVPLPFAVTFNGVAYSSVFIGSNGYFTFGGGSTVYSNFSPSTPPLPGVIINGGDRSYQRIYAGTDDGNATYRVRYEGNHTSSGTDDSPTVVWEITFSAANPSTFLLDIGAFTSSADVTGVTDGVGPSYLATFTSAINTGYTLTFSSPSTFGLSGLLLEMAPPYTSASWRIVWDHSEQTGVDGAVTIYEMQFRETVGTPQIFSGGTASASESISGTTPGNAADNNPATAWRSGTAGANWRYTFASRKKILQYTITADGTITGDRAPTGWRFQYLNENTDTWETLDTRTSTGWGAETRTFDVPYSTSIVGAITMPPFDVTGSMYGPLIVNGSITMPSFDVAGGGGPVGNFGNVMLLPPDVSGTFLTPIASIDGAVNLGSPEQTEATTTPFTLYSILVSGAPPNSIYGDIDFIDPFSYVYLSTNGVVEPPLTLPEFSVSGNAYAGEISSADIPITFDVSGTGFTGGYSDGAILLMPYDAAGTSINTADITLQPYDLVAIGAAGSAVAGAALLEQFAVDGQAYQSTNSDSGVVLQTFVVSGVASSSSVIAGGVKLPLLDVKGMMLSGQSMAGLIEVPLLQVSAAGYSSVIGTATIKIPALSVSGWMESIPAALSAADFKTIVMNSRTKAISTYEGLAANSLCEFNGVVLAATADGIVALMGEDDRGANIDAFISSSVSQYGSQFLKRVINGYIGYRADGKLKVTLYTDEHREYSYPLAPRQTATIHPSKVKFGRGVEGRYWQWKIANVAGADFQIDAYEMDVDVLTRRV